MSEYLILNFLIIVVPLLFSFENKIKYYRKYKSLSFSILITSSIFIIWDIIASARGDWSFNREKIVGLYIYNLPIEEVLFFITVPYSSIFIYENIKYFIKDQIFKQKPLIVYFIIIPLIILGVLFFNKYYTFTVIIFTILTLLLFNYNFKEILFSKVYFIFIVIMFVPFLIFNYFLTSIPIISYSKEAILNIRFITIPIEDFLYSFSLVSLYLFFYVFFESKWLNQKKSE